MERLLHDLRYALRTLRRSPGFALVAVLTLGLGIGANAAIFSVVNGVLLRSLPFHEAERLVELYTSYPGEEGERYPLSPPDFMSYHDHGEVFAGVSAVAKTSLALTGEGDPVQLDGGLVAADFFQTLGVNPVAGRLFRPEENREGNDRVVLLGHALWRQRFGADPGVVGRTLTLNGNPHLVVGVLPAGFDYPEARDLYRPLRYNPTFSSTTAEGRRGEYLTVVARLRPGVARERAEAAVGGLSDRLRREFPETNEVVSVRMIGLRDELLGGVRTPLLVLLGAVGLVLLIACANVANLLLARAAARENELAVRTALGAGRGRLVGQLLTESAVLAALGGAVGLLLAVWGTQALVALRPEGIPRLDEVGVDGAAVAFTAAVTLLTALLFGLVPAVQVTRGTLAGSLREGGRGAHGSLAGSRVRSGLVVAEMALSLMLLVGAGLLVRSFLRLTEVDPGFRAERTVAFDLVLPSARYGEPERRSAFYGQLFQRLEALPGVRSVGGATELPLTGYGMLTSFAIEGREVQRRDDDVNDLALKVVTPGYFRTLGIPLRRGRLFGTQDQAGSPPVLLLNEAAARRYLPGADPLVQHVRVDGVDTVFRAVVGVVGDVRQAGLDEAVRPEAYVLYSQAPRGYVSVAVRTAGDPLRLARAIRREVHALDPALPLEEFRTLDSLVSASVARPRFYMLLLTLFASVALVLAAVGVFGVVSYAVAQRTREIGIRMALGAEPGSVRALVVGGALRLALLGVAVGGAGALLVSRSLSTLLYGVSATDPLTFAAVAGVLTAVAAVASFLPARRATRVDPMVALRGE